LDRVLMTSRPVVGVNPPRMITHIDLLRLPWILCPYLESW